MKTLEAAVNHPAHYQSVSDIGRPILAALGHEGPLLDLECIEAIEALESGSEKSRSFAYLNAIKYLWRAGLKGDAVTDLQKARWYLNRQLQKYLGQAADPAFNVSQRYRDQLQRAMDLIDKSIHKIEGNNNAKDNATQPTD